MSNNQPAVSGDVSRKLWQIVTRASTGQMTEAALVTKLRVLLLDQAPSSPQEPWGWIAHCAKSGGEPIIVNETVAKELSKFDDWDVFQVARLPQSGTLSATSNSEVPIADKTEPVDLTRTLSGERQRVARVCDQPQAHPARCGCNSGPDESMKTARQLFERVLAFDKAPRVVDRTLFTDIQNFMQEQAQ